MGMFDYVDIKIRCPKCKGEMEGFQSKDGECFLCNVKPSDVRNFYTSCKHCETWVEVCMIKQNVPYDNYVVYSRNGDYNAQLTLEGTLDKFIIE